MKNKKYLLISAVAMVSVGLAVVYTVEETTPSIQINDLRGVGMGASCSEIEAIETRASIHRIESGPEEFGYRTTHKGFPALILYKCSEDSWSQSVTYGEFDKDEAANELAKIKEELTETYGNMKPLNRNPFVRLFSFNHPLVGNIYIAIFA